MIDKINDILLQTEFRGLTPIECLIKILKENKEHKAKNENN